MNKKYTLNENFFDELNEDSCYFLGWLLTDGHIQYIPNKKYSIRFELSDLEAVETLKELIGADNKVTIRDDKVNNLYLIVFNSKKLIKKLLDLGIKPGNKTSNIKFIDVPDEYKKDLIRGIFDGDGSVFISRQRKHPVIGSYICSTSKELLIDIGNYLKEEIDLIPKIYEDSPGFYKLRYGAKESYALYSFMYEGAKYYLRRKKAVFEEGLKNNLGTSIGRCKRCDKEIMKTSNRSLWCKDCKKLVKREQWRKSGARKRQKQ